ncbi:MAG TPA: DUF3108 domain-containing protein [Novimethylophilus sp.]|uniref:DUF3108 domain-containing protein n=1 Tax=Novimethylophilus sp. TaxID=2137426 RepID=UPI002F416B0A
MPDWAQSRETIDVTLAPLPKPLPVIAPAPRPQPRQALPQVKKPARSKPKSKTVEPPPQEAVPASPAPSVPVAPVEALRPQETSPAPVAEQGAAEEQGAADIAEEPAVVPPAPKRVEIDFQLARGKGGTPLGKVKQAFKLEDDNRYTLHSVAEASGLVSLFVSGKFEEHSEGQVTEHGLQPLSFRQQRGSGKSQSASFNWGSHTVAMEAGDRRSSVEIVDGTQDMLSFLYQFMFVPPLEQMRVTVANGKKLKTYVYSFEGEQKLETRMGTLRVIHIAKSSGDADEKTEVWLAADYRYLPVKIRQTDKDGTVTEQLATRLLIE